MYVIQSDAALKKKEKTKTKKIAFSTLPGSLKFLSNFHEISRLILLRIVNLCLQISSDFKRYLGFEIKEIVELGHTIKSRWS